MDVLISRVESTVAPDLELVRGLEPGFGADGLGHILEYGTGARPGPTPASAASLYMPGDGTQHPRVAIGASMRLFRGAWAEALLAAASSLVAPGGRLILSVYDGRTGEWTKEDAAAFFGQEPERKSRFWHRRQLVELVCRSTPPKARPSVLSWFLARGLDIVEADAVGSESDDAGRTAARDVVRRLRDDRGAVGAVPASVATAMTRHAYYVGGISYKAAGLRFIHDTLSKGRPWRRLVDVGGGYGLLGAELLLDDACGVQHSTTVDISPLNQTFAGVMGTTLALPAGRSTEFVLSGGETYAWPAGGVDAISYVGSLLYVPKPLRADCVARAFAALEPGGVLIVHENIKAPSYKTDYDLMFEPAELDALLATHGTIRYFSSTALQQLEPATVAAKTVFRAVVKG